MAQLKDMEFWQKPPHSLLIIIIIILNYDLQDHEFIRMLGPNKDKIVINQKFFFQSFKLFLQMIFIETFRKRGEIYDAMVLLTGSSACGSKLYCTHSDKTRFSRRKQFKLNSLLTCMYKHFSLKTDALYTSYDVFKQS